MVSSSRAMSVKPKSSAISCSLSIFFMFQVFSVSNPRFVSEAFRHVYPLAKIRIFPKNKTFSMENNVKIQRNGGSDVLHGLSAQRETNVSPPHASFLFLCSDVGQIPAHKGNNGRIRGYDESELQIRIMHMQGGQQPEKRLMGDKNHDGVAAKI